MNAIQTTKGKPARFRLVLLESQAELWEEGGYSVLCGVPRLRLGCILCSLLKKVPGRHSLMSTIRMSHCHIIALLVNYEAIVARKQLLLHTAVREPPLGVLAAESMLKPGICECQQHGEAPEQD